MSALRSKWQSLLVMAVAPASVFAFEVFGDFLFWKPSEQTALVWASPLGTEASGVEYFKAQNFSFDWDAGFRVGAGYTFGCDCWDIQAYWTHYRTQGKNAVPEREGQVISTQFFGGFLNNDDQVVALSANIRIDFKYDMFDAQLGRRFCFCDCFSLRPCMGLKGGWIDQNFWTNWQDLTLANLSKSTSQENLTQDFWGVGPSIGVEGDWDLGHHFFFFGSFETALLWGTWANTDHYTNSLGKSVNTNMKDTRATQLTLKIFSGLGWQTDLGCWAQLAFRFGYEAQVWFSQLRIPTFIQLREHGDLTLQGATINVSVEF